MLLLDIRHLGPQGEVHMTQSYPLVGGSCSISNLARKMNVEQRALPLDPEDPSIGISLAKTGLSVSLPNHCKLRDGEGTLIWAPGSLSIHSANRTTLGWVSTPKMLVIDFTNGEKLEITLRPATHRNILEQFKRVAACLILAFAVHFFCSVVGILSWRPGHRIILKPVDLSKLETVNVVQAPPTQEFSESASSEEVSAMQMAQARKLLNSWGIPTKKGSRIKTADASKAFDDAFKGGTGAKTGKINAAGWRDAWRLDAQEDEKPLNLSEAQILAVIQKVQARLKECYEDALIFDSALDGTLQLAIDVAAKSGVVTQVNLGQKAGVKTSSRDKLRSCFASAFRSVAFPNPSQDFTITQTLNLTRK